MKSQRSRSRSPSSRSNQQSYKGPSKDACEPSNKVYVCFLPSEIQENQLKSTFSQCGEVISIQLKKKDDGFTFAFIEYRQIRNAQAAIQKLNRRKMGQKNISVKYATPKPGSGSGQEQKKTFNKNNDNRGDREKKPFVKQGRDFKGGDRCQRRDNGDRGNFKQKDDKFSGNRNGGGQRKEMKCFKCQGFGHMSRSCPQSNDQPSDNYGKKRNYQTETNANNDACVDDY